MDRAELQEIEWALVAAKERLYKEMVFACFSWLIRDINKALKIIDKYKKD